MSSVVLSGDSSGSVTLTVPSAAGSNTATVPAQTGTLEMLGQGTAVSASGTSIDFTGIPSWAKRITVMFQGISTNGSSNLQIQIGSGSVTSSGYVAISRDTTVTGAGGSFTAGFGISSANAVNTLHGHMTLTLISGNTWVASHTIGFIQAGSGYAILGGGNLALGGALDRVRLTTVNGTDTFDAGSVNILYEG